VRVDVVDLLTELGGVARRQDLPIGRAELDAAVAAGTVVRDTRGLYALPHSDEAVRAAARVGGSLCLLSAALQHGWAVKTLPAAPQVLVSRGRRLSSERRRGVSLRWGESVGPVTSPETTLDMCLRSLPFDEALAVADSALREGFGVEALQALADRASGPGSRQVRRVAAEATPLAANPFESVLRAICLDVPGLQVSPQVQLLGVRPDLVDQRLGLVLEADSFAWHGGREALARDARRYNLLVVEGWIVLRFSYEEVMHHPQRVADVLIRAVALAELLKERDPQRSSAA
jgi:very-short-patch-repair endonuclease